MANPLEGTMLSLYGTQELFTKDDSSEIKVS